MRRASCSPSTRARGSPSTILSHIRTRVYAMTHPRETTARITSIDRSRPVDGPPSSCALIPRPSLDGRRRSDSARRSGARGDAMRGADLEVEDEDEAGAAVVARVVVEDDGGDLKGATPSTTMNALGESASAASTSDGDDETTVVGARLERCVREILRAMGEDVTREGLLDTPARVAKALTFAMRGYGTSATAALGTALFHEDGLVRALRTEEVESGTHDMVLVRDIPVFSTCAETFMPFYGVIHVGYVPHGGVIVGLSKLARVAEVYARRLQTPDGLAHAVAHALHDVASPLGVGVMFTGVHLGPFGTRETAGRASTGCFASPNSVWWEEFSALVEHGGGPSELSRGLWGDDVRCLPCDDDENASSRGPAETFVAGRRRMRRRARASTNPCASL